MAETNPLTYDGLLQLSDSEEDWNEIINLNKSVALHPQYPVARSKLDHLALSLEVT